MEICNGCDKVLDSVAKLKEEFEHDSKDIAVKIALFEGEKKELLSMTKSMHKRLDDSNRKFEEHMKEEEKQRAEQTDAIRGLSNSVNVYIAKSSEGMVWMRRIAYAFGIAVIGALSYIYLNLVVAQKMIDKDNQAHKYYNTNRSTIIEIIEGYKVKKDNQDEGK